MLILGIRTDKPEAELHLFDNTQLLDAYTWQAHRKLAETIHVEIKEFLAKQSKQLSDIEGIVVYKGPGSFTGLRIGLSVANALSAGFNIPIVGTEGEDWLNNSITRIIDGENDKIVLPEYGAPVHITQAKK